jgi:hypothetical protein
MTKTTAINQNQNTGESFVFGAGVDRTFYREGSESYAVSVDGTAETGYRGIFVTHEYGSFEVDGYPSLDLCLEGIERELKANQNLGDFPLIDWRAPQALGV